MGGGEGAFGAFRMSGGVLTPVANRLGLGVGISNLWFCPLVRTAVALSILVQLSDWLPKLSKSPFKRHVMRCKGRNVEDRIHLGEPRHIGAECCRRGIVIGGFRISPGPVK